MFGESFKGNYVPWDMLSVKEVFAPRALECRNIGGVPF